MDGEVGWKRKAESYARSMKSPRDSLSLFLTEQGFLENEIQVSDGDAGMLLNVRFGPRYYIGRIIIEGDINDTISINSAFSNNIFNSTLDEFLRPYQESGRYYVSMIPVRFEKYNDKIDVYMKAAEGPLVHVSDIEFAGLKRTDIDFMRKLVGINRGDIISMDNIDRSQNTLGQLDFAWLTGSPEVIPDAGYETARIRYNLSERQQFYFEGAAGYIPEDDGYYVWYLDIKGRNLFGRGQRAGLLGDSREKYKSIFRVYYGQPLFLLGPGNIQLNIQTRDYRDQFYEFALGARYELSAGIGLMLNTELGWKNVEPSSALLRSFRVYEVGVGAKAGRIDNSRSAPVSFALEWQVKYSGRRYRQKVDSVSLERAIYNDSRAFLKAEAAATALGVFGGYQAASVYDIESSEKPLPVSELVLFGGPGTLRGYRNDQFSAQRLILSTSEMRLFFARSDYVYPFVDGAYYERYVLDPGEIYVKDDDIKFGYGIGIKLTSGSRDLKLEFSWAEGAKFAEPRLIISFSGQF